MDKNLQQQIGSELLKANIKNRVGLDSFKRQIAKKYEIAILKNSELLRIYHELPAKKRASRQGLPSSLRKRPIRSLSGVVNVSVLTKPWPCPGKCIFCPSQKNIPKSYLANEPAVQRAIFNKFSPYQQVANRLKALEATGHPIDKVELRVIGGTWSYYPKKYQEKFISECFRACNKANPKQSPKIEKHNASPLKSAEALCLEKIQKQNETARRRIVGIAVETRPDFINPEEIKWMRKLGITKVELGVQSVYDDVLKLNQRGHTVAVTITATQLLKNAGFKVAYQMMPGLYGSSFQKDAAMFQEIFANHNFQPDYLKIYPLALIKNTKLYKLYQQGKFKPYSEKELIKLLIEIKKTLPKWVRVERVIRDIPPADIVAGSKTLNLREVVVKEMAKNGQRCQCVRCREVGNNYDAKEKIYLFRENYEAASGREIFLSFENKARTKLFALLRLRLPVPKEPSSFQPLVRDLHTYGQMAQLVRGLPSYSSQHKGLGKKLLAQAEKIAKNAGYKNIAVISGVGVRPYYRKLGYKLKNTYMVKTLQIIKKSKQMLV